MKHSYCSISSSTEPTDDRSWDVRMFQVAVAVAVAVVLNCLVSLWCRRGRGAPWSPHCRSAGRCRYSSCPRPRRRCRRAMVVTSLEGNKKLGEHQPRSKSIEKQSKYFGGISRLSMVVETDFVSVLFTAIHGIAAALCTFSNLKKLKRVENGYEERVPLPDPPHTMEKCIPSKGFFCFFLFFKRNCNNFSSLLLYNSESRTGIVKESLLKLLKLLSARISLLCDFSTEWYLFSVRAAGAECLRHLQLLQQSQFRSADEAHSINSSSCLFFIIQIDYFAFSSSINSSL